ncbi:MAG TPA: magnesium/cobalt transporter CorA [Opitutaceae bacterium]|nr:magnesium/cobalt transporter CorA [Opitutaceae bacterium]
MIRSFVFSEGKPVGRDLEIEALRLIRADKGLHIWVDLDDPTDEEIKLILENVFAFHPLAIEDCVTPSSLPKIEDYEDYLFIVTHAVDFSRAEQFNTTELDLFLGKGFLVTFHRKPLKSVQSLVDRCAKATGIVARAPDRLAHILIDQLVDLYKPVLDELRAEIDGIEDAVLKETPPTLINDLVQFRSELADFRRIIRPQRDLMARIVIGESKIVRALMLPYFRDLKDNLMRFDEAATGLADQLLLCFDLYLNKSASEANEGIKVLTALTAISLPPIMIGTWFGMNFEHMPELASPLGYPIALGAMIVSTGIMFIWCKRRGWL